MGERLRIGLVVPRYLPHLGGIENHVAALAVRLADRGHAVTVATQREADAALPAREVDAHGVVVRRFPSAGRLRGQGLSPALWAWVRRGADRAQVVHLHNLHALTTLPALAAARPPVVLTPHHLGPGEGWAEELLHRGHAAAARRVLPKVGRIVCTTPSEAASFARHLGAGERCVVVPNGVDAAAIRAASPVPAGGGRLVVVAGRLEEYKQPHRVLEALPLLAGHRLAVAGAGPLEPVLRRRAGELGVADRVRFCGRLSPAELYRWYRAADVVVSLSRRECFGLTVAEGLAAGAAVVASDIGPHRDVVALAGVPDAGLVPVDAPPDRVAAAVAAARRPPAPVRLPDWDDVTDATEACYEQLLAVSG
ncbi:glycosyltransferase family 4 protein [Geodermatophilus sp. URMC 62]|uniref:glycosyltransferase family 4 protein n=1 Tax=Geodermatophilus sp. URMC 62 TaxID=3423414 RepID=UPI00406C57AD